ncbi:hypothetical protein MYX07_00245 [Patescibacteria group bacterium AH-259-L07]|nr:hypothetical protein [Patescibacteria group bacterium AH-259-L07]
MLTDQEIKIGKLKQDVIDLALDLEVTRIEKQAMDITCEKQGDYVRLLSLETALHNIQRGLNEMVAGGIREYN